MGPTYSTELLCAVLSGKPKPSALISFPLSSCLSACPARSEAEGRSGSSQAGGIGSSLNINEINRPIASAIALIELLSFPDFDEHLERLTFKIMVHGDMSRT